MRAAQSAGIVGRGCPSPPSPAAGVGTPALHAVARLGIALAASAGDEPGGMPETGESLPRLAGALEFGELPLGLGLLDA